MALPSGLSEASMLLYDRLLQAESTPIEDGKETLKGYQRKFYQDDLAGILSDTANSVQDILPLINQLTNYALLRALKGQGGQLCWSTRPREAAKTIKSLTPEELALYGHVESAHNEGIWIKDLKKRSNMPAGLVDKAVDKLQKKSLIKSVRHQQHPAQKVFMLYHLAPSEEVTGGSFYDGGVLDESLVEEVSNLIVFHVRMQSWADPKRVKKEHSPVLISDEELVIHTKRNKRKRKRTSTDDIEDGVPRVRTTKKHGSELDQRITQLAYPAGSHEYPTASSIHAFITNTDAIRPGKAQQFTLTEIRQIIDLLVWDEKLEKVGEGYRTVRGVTFKPPGFQGDDGADDEEVGSALTQMPCGRCPVFDVCEEGGPVNAISCEYLKAWLKADAG